MDKDLGKKLEALESEMDRMRKLLDRIKGVEEDQKKILSILGRHDNE